MRSAGSIFFLLCYFSVCAQENSPYSRYGLGDIIPNQNIITRGMGGISAAYSDEQTVNFVNPASYGNLSYVDPAILKNNSGILRRSIFDFGFEVNTRRLRQNDPPGSYSATNLVVSYIQLGIPVRLRKANKKGIFLGLNMGLRPVSRINYKILNTERKPGVDSLATLYEGSGGLSEALIGADLRIKNFNLGFNSGYRFGNKAYTTIRSFLNDSVAYYQSKSSSQSDFGGLFFTLGAQYEHRFRKGQGESQKTATLRLGAYTTLTQQLTGNNELLRETVSFDESGGSFRLDSIYSNTQSGSVSIPSSWGAGFLFNDFSNHWRFGMDYERANWNNYTFFGQKDLVQNTWKIRAGAEFFPAELGRTPFRKYFSYVKYRAGFQYGSSYVNLGRQMPEFGISLGAGFPLKLRTGFYETQSSYLNTAIEFGTRGNNLTSLRESFLRICVGFALSDLWFNRSKYY